jgi:hypothetical protein
MTTSADFVPDSSFVPETSVTAEQITARFKLTLEGEGERVLLLALTTLNTATIGAWRSIPVPVWDDFVIRTCGAIVAAKKLPSSGAGQETRADQGTPRPGGPRAYLAGVRDELAQYVNLGLA